MKTTEHDLTLMQHYAITCEQTSVYRYKTYQYAKFQDALNFAMLDHASAVDEAEALLPPEVQA